MRICKCCGQQFAPHHHRAEYCLASPFCRGDPAVYRFICPDGRSYVGSRRNIRNREKGWVAWWGLSRRLRAALDRHPPATWSFEILEWLPPRCAKEERLKAEQHHIDRLRSWSSQHGFNTNPAWWSGTGPSQRAGRRWKSELLKRINAEQRATQQ
jgi:hypothetical protein